MCVMAYSITLGTRNKPFSSAGALHWLASRLSGSLTRSSRNRKVTSCRVAKGWVSGSMPVVSTARIFSTNSKKPLTCVNIRSLSAGLSSSRAKLAMRAISADVRDITDFHSKRVVKHLKRGCDGSGFHRGWGIIPPLLTCVQRSIFLLKNYNFDLVNVVMVRRSVGHTREDI